MTCLEIYKGALTLTGERPATNEADLASRATVILPMVIMSLSPLDRLIKRSKGNATVAPPPASLALESEWPLEDEFYSCAAHYLASELMASEDPELSAILYVRAEALRRMISEVIPFTIEKIR